MSVRDSRRSDNFKMSDKVVNAKERVGCIGCISQSEAKERDSAPIMVAPSKEQRKRETRSAAIAAATTAAGYAGEEGRLQFDILRSSA